MQYLVSIRLMTYMHEPFIKDAMDGIMMQETKFKVEVVVGDDFSTDRTLEIIKGYKNKENIHIRILERKKGDTYWEKRQKLGRLYNFLNIIENCQGKYIALLDGDDYWTDPLKLQKQVDVLEGNEEYAGCFHNAVVINSDTNNKTPFLKDEISQTTFKTKDLFEKWLVPTASFMFKNRWNENLLHETLPEWFSTIGSGDLALILWVSLKGKIKRLEDNMCVYRRHSAGLTSERAGDPIQFLILGHMYYNFNKETENLFLEDIKKGFDIKLKTFYNPYFKALYSNHQDKKDFYSKRKLYEQLGVKKIIGLMFYAINKKLFGR